MDKDKFAVAAVFKNELPFIVEWLAYHRVLGVSRFFIADNESDDGTSELLRSLSKVGYIECITYKTVPDVKPQLAAYQLLMETYGNKADWLCFIDADEFMRPAIRGQNIIDALEGALSDSKVGAVAVNWAVYGSSNWVTANSRPVIERFVARGVRERGVNRHYKTIVRTSAYKDVGTNPHVFELNEQYVYADPSGKYLGSGELGGLTDDVNWDVIRINHYVVKSRSEFFTKKRPRGRPNGSLRPVEFFSQHDMNDEDDTFPTEFLESVREERDAIYQTLARETGYLVDKSDFSDDDLFFTAKNPALKICIDAASLFGRKVECKGWVVGDGSEGVDFKILVDYKNVIRASRVDRMIRPDVASAYKLDPVIRYGFACSFDVDIDAMDKKGSPLIELCVGTGRHNLGAIISLASKIK
ncbi:glycosyltransferase family 2 protein [Burkholderia multivorans]|uniref:glycosyltransferase family 2 protein n=1 Tax=Burkholderia multivorans TaxID=87883 RepID=UPI001C22991D|nr:glycosyltransferase family 2 protein [Burkholderia multivorans]MBU9478463.1 glycosyltransferase family 2 protein [Burkholderia multivorans]